MGLVQRVMLTARSFVRTTTNQWRFNIASQQCPTPIGIVFQSICEQWKRRLELWSLHCVPLKPISCQNPIWSFHWPFRRGSGLTNTHTPRLLGTVSAQYWKLSFQPWSSARIKVTLPDGWPDIKQTSHTVFHLAHETWLARYETSFKLIILCCVCDILWV